MKDADPNLIMMMARVVKITREVIEKQIAEIEQLHNARGEQDLEINKLRGKIEWLMLAIRSTASDGTYNEGTIRKAVSFELAELIVDAHHAMERKP